jgi:hypothetical protein
LVGHEIWRETPTNVKNEKCTLKDLEYGEKREKRGKLDTNSVGHGVRQETLKKAEIEKCALYTWNIERNIEKQAK